MTRIPADAVTTTCPYCGVGCGVRVAGSGEPEVTGAAEHPANLGRLCVKGASLGDTLGPAGRLLQAQVAGREVALEQALDASADAIRAAVQEHGPASVGFYLSGQLLTEDYYVANKLAKGFVGTPHVDTNSRLCMSSAVAAHKRAFGEDLVPGCYDDMEQAELLVLVGSNAAWNHPVLYQRIRAMAREGRRLVLIDPRRTATADLADLHLPLRPGTDTLLFNGLLTWLEQNDALDRDYIAAHCEGFDQALGVAWRTAPGVAEVAAGCDLPEADVRAFYQWFAQTPATVSLFSQGANQSASGTDNGNAVINCHLATGRIGRPGAGPFSLTGQPNAMGGREVGGLANTLAAHMDYSPGNCERVGRFWRSDRVPAAEGHKAVELFEAVHRGEIRVLWILGTNPAVSLPETDRVREALERCPTVIVSDCIEHTDTTAFADILLPAAGWGEKDGTVTNSERCISRQRAFLPLPGAVKPDWWLLSQVAARLDHAGAFSYRRPADIFREHAALSAFENEEGYGARRVFNLEGLQHLDDVGYEQLQPLCWPVLNDAPGGQSRLFTDGRFATDNGRARFVPITPALPQQQPGEHTPLVVNSGRIRDQWHTMTRTGRAPKLLQHREEPFIEVHPQQMHESGLSSGDLAVLRNGRGTYTGRVRAEAAQRPGEVFVPIHWNRQFTGDGVACRLMASVTDPVSGQPEAKHGVAALEKLPVRWHARLLLPNGSPLPADAAYCTRVPLVGCSSWWLAGTQAIEWAQQAALWLGGDPGLVMSDPAQGRYRAARLDQGRLQGVLLVEPQARDLPPVDWLAECFGLPELDELQSRCLLAGRASGQEDPGAIVCSCFQVGEKQIARAVAEGCTSTEALGQQLRCGTNCGSCLPELRRFLATETDPA